ncbi:MAG: hypothetical protein ACXWTT_00940 [Methylobacter sp.]
MAKLIKNNLKKEELIEHLSVIGENSSSIVALISSNWGKDTVIFRRTRTITEKIHELILLIEER